MEQQMVREFYAAINRNDIAGALRDCDAAFVWVDPDGATYAGIGDVSAHFARARGRWAEGSCEPEELIVAGDHVVALVAVRVRLRDEPEWREGRLGDVFAFRDGRMVRGRTFVDPREALAFAGAGGYR